MALTLEAVEQLVKRIYEYPHQELYVGMSEAFQKMMTEVERYVHRVNLDDKLKLFDKSQKIPEPLLITGEQGTGKTCLVKYVIHPELASRKHGALVEQMGANFTQEGGQLTLHGSVEKGSTDTRKLHGAFPRAVGGVLFIDEIGDSYFGFQTHLLKSIEEGCCWPVGSTINVGPLNVLVIGATNKDVTDSKVIRSNLFDRFTYTIHVPPLRERKEDVLLYARWFLEETRRQYDINLDLRESLSSEACRVMLEHMWLDNVRGVKVFLDKCLTKKWLYNSCHQITEAEAQSYLHERRGAVLNKDPKQTDVGVVLITPRELGGIQQFFNTKGGFQRRDGEQSGRTYLKSTIPLNSGTQIITFTVTRAIQQGQQAIMGAVQALVKEARPKIVVLLGIAGSIDDSLKLGDVVVGDNVIFYEDRVESDKGTTRRLNSKSVPAWTLDKSGLFFADHGDPAILTGKDGDQFKIIPAPIGSGEAIVKAKNHEIRDYLKSMDYRTAVIEKEAMGFLQYFFEESLDKTFETEGIFIIRGVSDSADSDKDDSCQEKAAFNGMVVLYELLKSIYRE